MAFFADKPRMNPVRGLVPLHSAGGRYRPVVDLRRWLLLNRIAHRNAKVDLYDQSYHPVLVEALCRYAKTIDLRLSLRTACAAPPGDPIVLRGLGLTDVFLTPPGPDAPHFPDWLQAGHEAGLPIRVQLPPSLPPETDTPLWARRFLEAGVVVLDIAREDFPGGGLRRFFRRETDPETAYKLALACFLHGLEVNLVDGIPDAVPPELRDACLPEPARFTDHQYYQRASFQLARALYFRRPSIASTLLLALLARSTARLSQLDNLIIRLTLDRHESILQCFAFLHRITRLGGRVRGLPRAEEPLATAMKPHPYAQRRRYYDAVDAARLELPESLESLAKQARERIGHTPCDLEIAPEMLTAENAHTKTLPSGTRWFSIANVEKRSSTLGEFTPPLTLTATFGGGMAEYVGFGFGRHARILCPMDGFSHQLALHIDEDGRYVLLRDGEVMLPVESGGSYFVPYRLPGRLMPQFILWNIDKTIVTQQVKIWRELRVSPPPRNDIKYSVVIVSSRYARRLQASLLSLARQRHIDPGRLEVILAYVPGLDATDDLIESMGRVYPDLRIVRSPFPEKGARSKGLMINESVTLAAGEWIVLLDADTLVPPDCFARLEAFAPKGPFVAPMGRKMLDPETTGRILLGDLDPSNSWDELLAGPAPLLREESGGVPIGYFQCVRKTCFDTVKYREYGHFEGADYRFALDIRDSFGPEQILDGLILLHLDHGGSHWFGAPRHY